MVKVQELLIFIPNRENKELSKRISILRDIEEKTGLKRKKQLIK